MNDDDVYKPLFFGLLVAITIWATVMAAHRVGTWVGHVDGMRQRIERLEEAVDKLERGQR
jgi:hypothetical protein